MEHNNNLSDTSILNHHMNLVENIIKDWLSNVLIKAYTSWKENSWYNRCYGRSFKSYAEGDVFYIDSRWARHQE
jgi:hypothetical protein